MGFFENGKKVERRFSEFINTDIFSTTAQDISEHWDVGYMLKFDVKGLKKISRSDNEVNENIHWVEIKNVNGLAGWLYGEATHFVFELIDYWLIIEKNNLQEYIAKKTIKEYTEKPTINKLYKRNGRKDIITLVKTIDLIHISTAMLIKNNEA